MKKADKALAEAASSVLAKIVNNALMKATGSVVTEKAVEALAKHWRK